ncbi:MAG: hypothetical protein IJ006_01750, partial [Lachnospiraceae bacterium]|nr:hypothetical protein [Lachnospiraceae bacterium]
MTELIFEKVNNCGSIAPETEAVKKERTEIVMGRRVFLVVLDSVGIGALPDAELYGDAGSNTLLAASNSNGFAMPNMEALGLFDIEGVKCLKKDCVAPSGAFGRLKEAS